MFGIAASAIICQMLRWLNDEKLRGITAPLSFIITLKYMDQKFFLYARKSTDVDDKQALSIEAQIAELKAFAKKENIFISKIIIEKKTAKVPGRPLFNDMLNRLEKGEAQGILSWHPDRLARNSVDGGRIIYLLDTGKLSALKFPQFWYENTAQGKFMLNMAFGQSKYYVDSLSENVKRGLRQKVRNGIYPSLAPIGYINDVRKKTVMVDRKRSVIVREAFELYAKGNSGLWDISNFFASHGIFSSGGKHLNGKVCEGNKPFKLDRITFILSNPFYYGHFRYGKEVYEGKHPPIITKNLFDQVQAILKKRSRPQYSPKNDPEALCGLVRCGSCSMGITAEYKIKRQKNGNEHHYTYYHCTRKNKVIKCSEPCIREEVLATQLSSLIEDFSLPEDWANQMFTMLEKDEKEGAHSSAAFVQESKEKTATLSQKLQRLLDSYLEQDIEREVYLHKKAELMSEKKSLEEKIVTLEQQKTGWIEPLREWVKEAQNGVKIARGYDLVPKKVIAKKLFGSNLLLTAQNLSVQPTKIEGEKSVFAWPIVGEKSIPPYSSEGEKSSETSEKIVPIVGENLVLFGGKNPWDALRFARQLFANNLNENTSRIPESVIVVARRGIEPLLTA